MEIKKVKEVVGVVELDARGRELWRRFIWRLFFDRRMMLDRFFFSCLVIFFYFNFVLLFVLFTLKDFWEI